MQAKHTPGPWRAETWDYSLRNPPENIPVVVSHDLMICECNSNKGHYNPYTHTLETAQANAALIAAAPELLEALKCVLAYADAYSDAMRKIGRGAEELGTTGFDPCGCGALARAAIRKAEGGAA